jgi:hypothetical protein
MKTEWTLCTLKEYFEHLLKVRANGIEKALKLQAKEYERRLNQLNHAHEQNIERNAEFVSEEKFVGFVREFREYKETTDKALQIAQGVTSGVNKTIAVIVGCFTFLLIILGIIGWVIAHAK